MKYRDFPLIDRILYRVVYWVTRRRPMLGGLLRAAVMIQAKDVR